MLRVEEEEASCFVTAAQAARAALSEQGGLAVGFLFGMQEPAAPAQALLQPAGPSLHTHPSTEALWGGRALG